MKMKKLLISLLLIVTVCFAFGCGEPPKPDVSITFKQAGQSDIVVTVKQGETLENVPSPVQIDGYIVEWNCKDFSNIQEEMVVVAVSKPKTITITYDLGKRKDDANATISKLSEQIDYKENLQLPIPSCVGFDFQRWVIKDTKTVVVDGECLFIEDVTLVAVWNDDFNSGEEFSPIV